MPQTAQKQEAHAHHAAHAHDQADGQAPAMAHGDHGDEHAGHGDGHGGHGVDHTGHEQMFRRKFWVSLVLSIPVLLYSEMLQSWLGFTVPTFPGSQWIGPLFAIVIFFYGGWPFIDMAIP
ncbi:hypothetical protein RY27_03230, partial [Litorilinea aerophila]